MFGIQRLLNTKQRTNMRMDIMLQQNECLWMNICTGLYDFRIRRVVEVVNYIFFFFKFNLFWKNAIRILSCTYAGLTVEK